METPPLWHATIYINDHLTKHRQSVLYSCRQQVRRKKLFAAWSQGGNILVRREENGTIIQVFDHEDLRELCMNILPSEQEFADGNGTNISRDESSIKSHLSNYSYGYDSDI